MLIKLLLALLLVFSAFLGEKMIHVTIGVCTKNSQNTLRQTLESIQNLEYPKDLFEVIIVDGKSKDNTIAVAKQFLIENHLQWTILSDEGKGLGYARQQVVDHAKSQYIGFVDADQTLHHAWLKNLIAEMQEYPAAAAIRGIQGITKQLPIPASIENYLKHIQDSHTGHRVQPANSL